MIYETKEISSELLSGLKPNNYTRRIKSHFAAYGTEYDFLHFYAVEESGEKLGIISVFNASMMISTFKDKRFDDKVLGELAGFILMNKPAAVEFEAEYSGKLAELTKEKEDVERQLEEKMERWEYLNDLAEKIEKQKQ